MKRILFHTWPNSISRPVLSCSHIGGVTYPIARSISQLRPQFSLTGNRGNMIHSEATQKLFKFEAKKSAVTNLVHLYTAINNEDKFAEYINCNFDCLIVSTANIIRPRQNYEQLIKARPFWRSPV